MYIHLKLKILKKKKKEKHIEKWLHVTAKFEVLESSRTWIP